VANNVLREIEQFLYRDARLLDERRFREWLDLFTADARYWMPLRSNRYPRASKALAVLDPTCEPDRDLSGEGELAFFDETKSTLERRIARLETGMAWAEDPPSRTRHLITNVEIEPGGAPSELKAYSNFIVYRTRAETEREFYVGSRQDLLRRVEGLWRIASRRIVLDETVLSAKNVSIFF
jgi:3-phenylpropionate/cinnamic acid dioxygenase small subunit